MTRHDGANNPLPIIDSSRCTGCGLCVRVCPNTVLMMKDGTAVVANPHACIYVGHCERICPVQAISRPFQIIFSSQEEMKSMLYPDWQEKVVFAADGPQPEILVENERLKVIVAGLKPGQKIPPHPEALAVYHFLEGSGWMIVDDERHPVHAGATVITPEGARRGVVAETQLVFLAVRIANSMNDQEQ